MALAIFGISNDGLNLAVNLFILMLVVVWLALIVYTYLDARRRIADPFLVACATIGSFFPFIGTVVYAILRPPEFLEDAHERELEIRAAELRVRQLTEASCPNCEFPVESTTCAARSASTASRTPARAAASRSTRAGPSAPTARPRSARAPRRRRRPNAEASQRERRARASASAASCRGAAAETRSRRRAADTAKEAAEPRARPPRTTEPTQTTPKGAPHVSRTLILVKPDAFERALTGEVIARFERKGLRIAALKTMQADEPIANEHYAEHTEKPFFGELVSFITGGPLVAMVLEGARSGRRRRAS